MLCWTSSLGVFSQTDYTDTLWTVNDGAVETNPRFDRFSGWFLAKSALHKTVILLEIRRGGFPAGFHRSIIDGPHGMFVETVV